MKMSKKNGLLVPINSSLERKIKGVRYIDQTPHNSNERQNLSRENVRLREIEKLCANMAPTKEKSIRANIYRTAGIKPGTFGEFEMDELPLYEMLSALYIVSEFGYDKLGVMAKRGPYVEICMSKEDGSSGEVVYDTRLEKVVSLDINGREINVFDRFSNGTSGLAGIPSDFIVEAEGRKLLVDFDTAKKKRFEVDNRLYSEFDDIYPCVTGYTTFTIDGKNFMIVDKDFEEKRVVDTRCDLFTYNGQALFDDIEMHHFGHEEGRPRFVVFKNSDGNYSLVSEFEGSTLASVNGENEFKDVFVYGGGGNRPKVELTRLNGSKIRFANKRYGGDSSNLFFC